MDMMATFAIIICIIQLNHDINQVVILNGELLGKICHFHFFPINHALETTV